MISDAGNDSNSPTPTVETNKLVNVRPAEPRPGFTFRNYYYCPSDKTMWKGDWSCMCNDRCPTCGTEVEPYESEDI